MLPILYFIVINFTIASAEIGKTYQPLKISDFLTNYEIVSLHRYQLPEQVPETSFLKEHHHFIQGENQSCHRIWFEAYGKNFRMSLQPDHSLVSPSAVVEIHDHKKTTTKPLREIQGAEIFEGHLDEDNKSKIFGYFGTGYNNCVFTGIINTENCTYYLEPASNHFNKSFYDKAIVYREFDILYPGCGDNGSCKDFVHYATHTKKERKLFSVKKDESTVNDGYRDRTCSLEAIADHTFFEEMNRNEGNTIADMLYHVKTADSIFRSTDFDEDKHPDKIGFTIKKITIFEDKQSKKYPLANVESTPSAFLDKLSLIIQNYCLLVCFVHREFPDDVVGMAYRAEPDTPGAVGGICEKPVILTDGKLHSLNIAAISTQNRGRCIPKAIASNSLVHELGHCFGSLHDPSEDKDCSPGREAGNYIMSAYTNDGTRTNNRAFSLCSLRSINHAIEKKGNCLRTDHDSCCGNGITELGEECDCGNLATCDIVDPCCTPRGGLGNDKECTFRRQMGYVCSPRESSCCSKHCSFIDALENQTCSNNLPCSLPSTCDGKSSKCPSGGSLPDGIPCLGTAYTCHSGKCTSNVCLDHNLKSCQCSAESAMDCHICCLNESDSCIPASELSLYTTEGKYYLKLQGSLCGDENGSCNRDGECVWVPQSSKKETSETNKVVSWFLAHWPYILIIVLCVTIIALIVYITYYSGKQRLNTTANAVTLTSIVGPSELYSKDEFDKGEPQ